VGKNRVKGSAGVRSQASEERRKKTEEAEEEERRRRNRVAIAVQRVLYKTQSVQYEHPRVNDK